MHKIELVALEAIKPNPRNARTHSTKQIRQIADSIGAFGFLVPVLIDETSTTLGGHGRILAAKLRGLEKIPVIRVQGLSEAQKRALLLADNKIAENAGWDRERLAIDRQTKGVIPAGFVLQLYEWDEIPGSEDFHDRFFLTDTGGLMIGAGLSAEGSTETATFTLLDDSHAQALRSRFAANSTVYARVGSAVQIDSNGNASCI